MIILERIAKKKQREVAEWIHVAQHTDKWREFLNTVMDTVTQNGTYFILRKNSVPIYSVF